jgi:hypothetical protein
MIQNTENRATRTDAKVLRQRRSPGVVAASAAFGGLDRALEPRWRQAPDGRPAGGSQPTHSSRSNRRLWLAPSFLMHRGETSMKTEKKRWATLDIGSHSNARGQLLPGAEA